MILRFYFLGYLRKLTVRIAERVGWLAFVDHEIVENYLDPKSAAIRRLERLFRSDAFFFSASPTPITCVEVAYLNGFVAVRNSNDPGKVTTYFTHEEWQAFVNGVKRGKFDFPLDSDKTNPPV